MIASMLSFTFGADWWRNYISISSSSGFMGFLADKFPFGVKKELYYYEVIVCVTFVSVVITMFYQISRVSIYLWRTQNRRMNGVKKMDFESKMTSIEFIAVLKTFKDVSCSFVPFICYIISVYFWNLISPNSLQNFPMISLFIVGAVFTDMVVQLMISHMCENQLSPSKSSLAAPIVLFVISIAYRGQSMRYEAIILYGYVFFCISFMTIKYFSICKEIEHILGIYTFRNYSYDQVFSKDGARYFQMCQRCRYQNKF